MSPVQPDSDNSTTVDSAVLISTLDTIDSLPYHLASPITLAAQRTVKQLRIILVSSLFNLPAPENYVSNDSSSTIQYGVSRTSRWDEVQRLLTYVYVQATKVAQELGKILMDVDVLLQGTSSNIPDIPKESIERVYAVRCLGNQPEVLPAPFTQYFSQTNIIWLDPDTPHPHKAPVPNPLPLHPSEPLPSEFPVTALGGTFDHLHAGHRILLSMAAWITKEKLIVGLTDDILLQKKANKHILEPFPIRKERTHQFLTLFKPSVEYDIVPITDVYGPTGWDPNIQALVVSRETLSGGKMIEDWRREKSLPLLKTFVIDVISSTEASLDGDADHLKKAKMSSTFIREWIVQQQQQSQLQPLS